ncbi:MAG TPA: RsmE family RNA methyltransferase [Chitinophagaceae bacterium]
MALPFFYEKELVAGSGAFTLGEETSKHCIQVLRMRSGDSLNLTDGRGNLITASILNPDRRATEVKLHSFEFQPAASRKVTLAVSLLKNASRFEWFLEKATEIGVARIIPLLCERTERQQFRFSRMNSILISAMLQSQQVWLPVLEEARPFRAIVEEAHSRKFIAHCSEGNKAKLNAATITDDVAMLIGPEGDFSPAETALALEKNFQPVSLGDTRLRSETAAIVAATLLMNL